MAHGDACEGKWRGNWRMEWVASTLHTTSEHCVSSTTTAHAHTSAASSRLNWRLRRFKWTRPFRRKTKSGFCACAITFQLASTYGTTLSRVAGQGGGGSVWVVLEMPSVVTQRGYWFFELRKNLHVDRLSFRFLYLIVRPCQHLRLRNAGGKMTAESRIGRDLKGRIFGLFEAIAGGFFNVLLTVHLDIIVYRKTNLMHNLFLVYFFNLYEFRAYLCAS
jgi:hypothetical protein